MHQGHHGANHPVMDYTTGKVEVTSMNHGFAVDGDSLPDTVEATHTSLFDGSNCGCATRRCRSSPSSTIPRHRPARATATTCSIGSLTHMAERH
jgi:carbamoyl-phosphate synthase small subunit